MPPSFPARLESALSFGSVLCFHLHYLPVRLAQVGRKCVHHHSAHDRATEVSSHTLPWATWSLHLWQDACMLTQHLIVVWRREMNMRAGTAVALFDV